MSAPITQALHADLVKKYFEPFHTQVRQQYQNFFGQGAKKVYHLDAHSMPSMGTAAHRDPGQKRPQIVVSDCSGKSCEASFKDLVIESYQKAGFEVGYNWPYLGGRVTETYGHPETGQHAIQVEMSRVLYMNEETKQYLPEPAAKIQQQLKVALQGVRDALPTMMGT
jgi:N-formylglutamate deformylase